VTFRDGLGSVGSMVETSLLMDLGILCGIMVIMLRSFRAKEDVHHRLDDVTNAVGIFAEEVIQRTDFLMEKAGQIPAAIELHNHNPLEQIFSFIRGMQTGNFGGMSGDTNINPRESDGTYGARQGQEQEYFSETETLDINN
jgi:hypothetical protein